MIFNWFDIILLVILLGTFVLGIIKGLVRQIIGIVAVIVGLILALAYYAHLATAFRPLVKKDSIAHFLGFLVIFLVVILLGWLISRLFSKAMKGSVKLINHILGGGLGLVKGALICGVLVFALLVFPVNIKALQDSYLAPYCAKMTKGIVDLIPKELKEKFVESYQDFIGKRGKNVEEV